MVKAMNPDELMKALTAALLSLQQKAKSVAAGSVLPNLTITALAEGALIKQLHTNLQYAAQSTRAGALPAKQANASAVLELENARYEVRALERELEQCATVPTPSLDSLGLDLPTADAPEAHEATLSTLQSELDHRIELTNRVVALRKERDERARRVRKAEESLQSLPKRARRLATEAMPVRKFFLAEEAAGAALAPRATARPSDIGLTDWAQLPVPLYVLARQALACSATSLVVKARRIRNGTSAAVDAEKDAAKALHRTHEWMLDIDMKDLGSGADRVALGATLEFHFHPELSIVSLRVSGDDLEAAQLSDLFPNDNGRQSPNPANAYLLDGKFAFDGSLVAGRGGSARAFRWANALCGLRFLPETVKGVEQDHVLFSGALTRIIARVRAVQALRVQIRAVKKMVRERSKSSGASLDNFESVDTADMKFPGATEDATVFNVGCHAGLGKKIVAHIVVPASYPSSPPSLYMGRGGSIAEANIRQIEDGVNSVQGANASNMLLKQIEKFLHCVSVAGVESNAMNDDGAGEDSTRQVRGRGRVMLFDR